MPPEASLSRLSTYRLVNFGTPLFPRWIASDVNCAPADLNAAVDELVAQGPRTGGRVRVYSLHDPRPSRPRGATARGVTPVTTEEGTETPIGST